MSEENKDQNQEQLDPDHEDAQPETEQTEEKQTEAEKAKEKQIEAATETSKSFDEKVDEEDEDSDTDEDNKPSGEDKKGDEKDTAKTGDEKENTTGKDGTEESEAAIDDTLLTRAVKAGFDLSEARSFKSAEDLQKTIEIIESRQADAGDQEKDDTGKTETEDEIEFKPIELKAFELKFDNEEDLDPEITGAIKKTNEHNSEQLKLINDHYSEQFKNLNKQLKQANDMIKGYSKVAENQAIVQFESRFDSMVDTLPAEYEQLVGKGSGKSLSRDSQQLANRNKIIIAMKAVDQVHIDGKKPLLPEKDCFEQAIAMVFSDKQKEIATRKVAGKLTDRGKQNLSKPTNRVSKPLSPVEKAVQISRDFDAKLDREES